MNYKTIKLALLLSSLLGLANAANIATMPKAAPGDTATAGAGQQWPNTRFVADPSGNCITDNLTGLMWSQNARLLGSGTWGDSTTEGTAQYKVAQMNTNSSAVGYNLCGYTDWRLPTITELKSLINYGYKSTSTPTSPAAYLNDAAQGFTGVQPNNYWSSTPGGLGAWYVDFYYGSSGSTDVSYPFNVWPVRGGQ